MNDMIKSNSVELINKVCWYSEWLLLLQAVTFTLDSQSPGWQITFKTLPMQITQVKFHLWAEEIMATTFSPKVSSRFELLPLCNILFFFCSIFKKLPYSVLKSEVYNQ